MPYNPNIQKVYGEVSVTGGGGDVNVTNDPLDVAVTNTPTVNIGTMPIISTVRIPLTRSGGGTDVMKENFLSFLGSSLTNVMDEMVLAYMPTTTNQNITGVITVKEY